MGGCHDPICSSAGCNAGRARLVPADWLCRKRGGEPAEPRAHHHPSARPIAMEVESRLPEPSVDSCPLTGNVNEPGLYYTLVRWWPGFMSAPHSYTTDRFCVVVSGTWWCNSGADFDPAACVPAPAGSFVRRVAGTPHYDGVVRGHPEPAIIAICGMGPVNFALSDPSQPGVRRL